MSGGKAKARPAAPPFIIARCNIPSTLAVKALTLCGFDAILVDAQHGLIDRRAMFDLVAFGREGGHTMFVRTLSAAPEELGQALDAGADGLFVPMVNSVEQAKAVVRAVRYPPRGDRSWGPIWPKAGGHTRGGGDAPVIVAMVETGEGLDQLGDIARVDGIDYVYIGLNDLALSVGVATHPLEDDALRARVEAALRSVASTPAGSGSHVETGDELEYWVNLGCRLFVVGSDVGFLTRGARDVLRGLGRS